MPGNAFSSVLVFKNFPGEHAPEPPLVGPLDPQPSTFHKTPATEKLIYNPEVCNDTLHWSYLDCSPFQ